MADVMGKSDATPHGVKADGAPRRRPGPSKGTPRPPRKTAARAPASSSRRTPDYRPGVEALLQLLAGPLVIAGVQTGSVPLQADGAALLTHAPALADGVQAAAEQDPRAAALLDRLLKAGPYAALLTPLATLALQLGANHGLVPVPVVAPLGVMEPGALVSMVSGVPAAPPAPAGPDRAEVPAPREPEYAAAF